MLLLLLFQLDRHVLILLVSDSSVVPSGPVGLRAVHSNLLEKTHQVCPGVQQRRGHSDHDHRWGRRPCVCPSVKGHPPV